MAQINNKRIARNTLMLYGRTAFTMLISLFTSRVTLQVLGVDNYGINSAVAGVIAMFSVVSGSLSGAISRFITFELGHENAEKLNKIFSTSVNIQLIIGIIILLLGETLGVWFLNTQMNIPEGRMVAANWVLQCAIFSFVIGLSQAPYTACIVGHERMSVFAFFSIINSLLRLGIVYLLYVSPFDKLISYSVMGFLISLLLRILQRIYCVHHFEECHYHLILDKPLLKEMFGFAGWSFLTNTVWIFSTQGVNILINIFFGVAFNAARGLANTMEGAIKKFCNDFMTSMNPQITKSYAAGEWDEMNQLICRGARFSYYLVFAISLPFMYEAEFVLWLWLGTVPDYTALFFRLANISVLVTAIGQTGLKGVLATGNIKWYTIVISLVGIFVLPLTWFAYRLGAPVEISYFFFIGIYAIIDILRLWFMKKLWGFPIMKFVKETIVPILRVTVLSTILPTIAFLLLKNGWLKSVIVIVVCVISVCVVTYCFGMQKGERKVILEKSQQVLRKVVRK
ncbi:MAG: lipopolysaccharide biosynthesis protein [Bacteroidales bacterium]|nr:lipopolysaccharide biosynthesis protein [Bacteroidales bacterium]